MATICAHTLVKNEERFLWFAVSSVVNFVDRVLIWDTGSTDNTKKIIKLLKKKYPEKISIKFLKSINSSQFPLVRQRMLKETKEDWILMLDGDEIWWEKSIRKVTTFIQKHGKKTESIVVSTKMLIGDIFHYQEEKAGNYKLAGRKGHLSLRAVNTKIPGLSSKNPHGTWGWVDENGKMIQERKQKKIKYLNAPYLHASFLKRAGKIGDEKRVPKRKKKFKYELGISFPKDYYFPESFFYEKPDLVPSPWKSFEMIYFLKALIQTPLKKFKRRYLSEKVGY